MESWLFGHQRNIRDITCLPERIFWKITTREMIIRIYLHIYIVQINHNCCETSKKLVVEEIVAEQLSQWLSHHVMLSKVNAAYLMDSCNVFAVIQPVFLWQNTAGPRPYMYVRYSQALYPLEIFSAGLHGGWSKEPGRYGVALATCCPCNSQTSPFKTAKSQLSWLSDASHLIVPHHRLRNIQSQTQRFPSWRPCPEEGYKRNKRSIIGKART